MRGLISAAVVAALFLAAGCYTRDAVYRPELSSFTVTVKGIFKPRVPPPGEMTEFGDPGTLIPVVTRCQQQYGGDALVPAEARGTVACPYAIPRGDVELDVEVIAIGRDGNPLKTFTGPISMKVVPGDLTGTYPFRTVQMVEGVGKAVVKVAHLYSEVRVWAEDSPPKPIFIDGQMDTTDLAPEPESRTHATAASEPVWFEEPTLAKVQIPDGFDNRTSPFVGQFITIGRAKAENSEPVLQSCDADPEHDGKPALLVVTGTDPSGFFVTDLNACRMPEQLPNAFALPEPDNYFPGTFGSMFIYNYSFPEGLDEGDALWSVAGAIQEFTSTTQLTFPSWVVAERVRMLPEAQWGKYLSQVPIRDINYRICGIGTNPYITDVLCGMASTNLKMESLESSLVRLKNVKFPSTFRNCDQNGDGEVPFFCNRRNEGEPWYWGDCDFDNAGTITEEEKIEVACNIDCVVGQNELARTVCAERSTFVGFGQFIAELPGPGPAEAGLDPSIPARIEQVAISATSARIAGTYAKDNLLHAWCNTNVKYKAGDANVVATDADTALPANTRLDLFLEEGQSKLAFIADGTPSANPVCQVSMNQRVKFNVVTRDAVPELQPDCDPADADAAKALQCQQFRAATYDVVGHLRHLQPGRPRWVVLPRDKEDICCHPGPGLECPNPIKPCQQ